MKVTVLLDGHLDKQPEMVGWREGHGPWTPVLEGDKLYGRGGADDGYAMFARPVGVARAARCGRAPRRCVLLIVSCEESGSYDLPFYIDAARRRHRQRPVSSSVSIRVAATTTACG